LEFLGREMGGWRCVMGVYGRFAWCQKNFWCDLKHTYVNFEIVGVHLKKNFTNLRHTRVVLNYFVGIFEIMRVF
jgi:hypothetical protein